MGRSRLVHTGFIGSARNSVGPAWRDLQVGDRDLRSLGDVELVNNNQKWKD